MPLDVRQEVRRIGLPRLRKLATRIGRNRELAHALWKTDVYEASVIAIERLPEARRQG